MKEKKKKNKHKRATTICRLSTLLLLFEYTTKRVEKRRSFQSNCRIILIGLLFFLFELPRHIAIAKPGEGGRGRGHPLAGDSEDENVRERESEMSIREVTHLLDLRDPSRPWNVPVEVIFEGRGMRDPTIRHARARDGRFVALTGREDFAAPTPSTITTPPPPPTRRIHGLPPLNAAANTLHPPRRRVGNQTTVAARDWPARCAKSRRCWSV